MKKMLLYALAAGAVIAFAAAGLAGESSKGMSGEELFKEHCALCHPDGGNIINARKTLHKADLEANGIRKSSDLIGIMRNPGPGMATFDKATIPDKDARKIAEYVLKTFK
ncbi:MAG: c-type cytochrome [Nitrospiraceae bacterium]|nr:c-type cytochrome [Nitrospiraceae bacterium]